MVTAKKDWRLAAEEYFFTSHLSIEQIAALTEVSRQSISKYLKTLPEYAAEKTARKTANAAARKEYKKEKNRQYRAADTVTGETMRREHDIAALILSKEIYH